MITIYSEWLKPMLQIGVLFPQISLASCHLILTCSFLQVLTDHPASAWTPEYTQTNNTLGLPQPYLELE